MHKLPAESRPSLRHLIAMKSRAPYWILTGLLAAWLTLGGVLDTARISGTRQIMATLHYPDYMLLILGPCKLLAVLALLYPQTRFLREWAYTGIAIDALGAPTRQLRW